MGAEFIQHAEAPDVDPFKRVATQPA